jgi:hypothetical protein
MKHHRWILFIMAVASLQAGSASAGSEGRIGTGGAAELRMPVGARSVALSGANGGGVAGVEALFFNPAGIARAASGTEVLLSYSRQIADMDLNYLAVTQKMGDFGFVGINVKVLRIGDIPVTTEQTPDGTGEIMSPTFSTIGLSYAREITDRVTFGGTVNYVAERVLQETAGGVAFDFDGDDPNAQNRAMSLSTAKFELPSSFQFGASYPLIDDPNGTLALHGLYTSNSFTVDDAKTGAEYLFRNDFAVRAGYKFSTNDDELYGFTYGAGARLRLGASHLWIDYAGEMVNDFFDDVQHVTLTMQF